MKDDKEVETKFHFGQKVCYLEFEDRKFVLKVGVYLGSYRTSSGVVRHIVTYGDITSCVVRHVPQVASYDEMKEQFKQLQDVFTADGILTNAR